MPRPARDTRGVCRCGGRTELLPDPITGINRFECHRSNKPDLECDCEQTVGSFCRFCGEPDGTRAVNEGFFYSNGHRCRNRGEA